MKTTWQLTFVSVAVLLILTTTSVAAGSLYQDPILIHFGEMDSCECVTGNEWESLGVTFSSPNDLMIWMVNPGTECPPSRQALNTGSDCSTCADDNHDDFEIFFDPPVAWVSLGIWDNDQNPGDEYVWFVLENGDSMGLEMKVGPAACVMHSSEEVLPVPSYSPIVRVRVDESSLDSEGIAIDNVTYVQWDPDLVYIHFGEGLVGSCDCVAGTEWSDLGLTITSPYELMCVMRGPELHCPPSEEAITTSDDCEICSRNWDNDMVLTFTPPVSWVSLSLFDNDYTSPAEFIAYILTNGDSIAVPLRAGAFTCHSYASSDTLTELHSPIARVRIEEDDPDGGSISEAIDLDNVAFIPAGCPDTIVVPAAYPTIQGAIDAACEGTVILVEPGTYCEHDLIMKNGAAIISADGAEATVIDAQGQGRVLVCSGLDGSTVVEGLTLAGGQSPWGGGVYCNATNMIFEDCIFTANTSSSGGGAMALYSSSPTLEGCSFEANTAHGGGGIWMQHSHPQISYCVFVADSAALGGGIQCDLSSQPTISHCTFCGNQASQGGAGIHSRESSSPLVENSIIAFSQMGEGVHCDPVAPGTVILSCSCIYGNAGGDWVGCIADQLGQSGNLWANPLFCGEACDDLRLAWDSPCLPELCGQIGAFGLACWAADPRITSIMDVGNDQGRYARITWRRSGYDQAGDTCVTGYGIYRRQDQFLLLTGSDEAEPQNGSDRHPMLGLAGWDFADYVPARGDSVYQYVATTLCDSTDAGICWSTFFVSAMTADPYTYFDSASDSGYSVDNLEPNAPTGLTGEELGNAISLSWKPSPEEDLRYYRVYMDTVPGFDISSTMHIHSTPDTTELVGDIDPCTLYYFKVTAVDFAGNESTPSDEIVLCAAASIDAGWGTIEFGLSKIKPNPFTGSTEIRFSVPRASAMRLDVYDVRGTRIRTLIDEGVTSGRHTVVWDGEDEQGERVRPGIYFIRMAAGEFSTACKVILLR